MNSITFRPHFEGPDQYLDHVLECLAAGYEPLPPETRDELLAVLDEQPEYARRWLPSAEWCQFLGIDPDVGKPVAPLSEMWQERFLTTLAHDQEFLAAVRTIINGEAAA